MGRVLELTEAIIFCHALRDAGKRVVLTNGHFDLLHLGHVDYLQRAGALGDALLVGVNSDASTRALKGPLRPLTPDHERAQILAALACVDAAIIFDDLTANLLVESLRPDVYVKGGDWNPANATGATREPPEAAVVRAQGGEVQFLPYLAGHSTTDLIQKIVTRFS